MGLNPGRKRRNLPSLAIAPPSRPYTRRQEAELIFDHPIHLSPEGDVLHQKEWIFRGQTVDFALNYYVQPGHPDNQDEDERDVARVDCCHSEVHKHQFYRSGRPQVRELIRDLSGFESIEDAEAAVHECYDECYLAMAEKWESHLRYWKEPA